ncbi:MAG: GNAT family N-acetyltransferase [Solobacterium sp.]|nr:GNAT family N-acetyltransferase [Solobacterium sp.]
MNTEIIKAGPEDIESLAEMRIAYLQEDLGEMSSQEADQYRIRLREYFERKINKDIFCYVAKENEEVLSTAFLLVSEKPASPSFPNGRTGTILSVYTRPAYRGKGLARRVMEALVRDAENMDLCLLELKATEDGYSLYQKLGFKEDKSHYRPMKRML